MPSQNQRHSQNRKKEFYRHQRFGYENKLKYSICVKKSENKHVDFLFIEGEGKTDYVLIKSVNTFLYENALHLGRKYFCRYKLQCFGTVETMTCQIKGYFKTNGKQEVKLPKQANALE